MKRNSFPNEPTLAPASPRRTSERDWRQIMAERWHLWLTFVVIAGGGTIFYSLGLGAGKVPEWEYEIVAVHPHDPTAFTQGLHFYQGHLFESTGLEGKSSIRKVDIATGKPVINIPMDPRYFGEGLTMVGDQFFQLTWKSGVGFVYNADLQLVRRFDYSGQGWGLTFDGKYLIMSDGGTELVFLDPETTQVVRRLPVVMGSFKLDRINEMEYVDGLIYANRWQQDAIFVIHPETGRVVARIPLLNLLSAAERPSGLDDGSLNGIAYNPETRTFFVTGKKWPKMFEIRIKRKM
ncbi:MAG: glutaminyl-peptide cyclotransferase [Pirellulaceae bacterium]|nr:glutaminyl-peptide cyclotransferase [Pirellulaceae bacterium]